MTARYDYDLNGNRVTYTTPGGAVTSAYDDQDRLLQAGATHFTYTANGDLRTQTAAGKTTTYNYDPLGSLRSVDQPDGTTVSYVIDALNRRVGKRVDGVLVQGFLYKNYMILAELDGASRMVSRFVYASHGNGPDYMVRDGDTYVFVNDPVGSVRLVVNAATGAIAQRLDYDTFGSVLLDTRPGFQPFGFAGGLYDRHTSLTRFGARDYDPSSGRWTAKDPIRFAAGDTNLYGYVWNDPINLTDPSGLGCAIKVYFVKGDAWLGQTPTYCEGQPLRSGMVFRRLEQGQKYDIAPGDTVITGRKTRLIVDLPDGSTLRMGIKSTMLFDSSLCVGEISEKIRAFERAINRLIPEPPQCTADNADSPVCTMRAIGGTRG